MKGPTVVPVTTAGHTGNEGDSISCWDAPVDIGKLFTEPPQPMRWFIRDRLQLGRGGVLAGIGGSSKTRLLYHLGIGSCLGTLPWGWEVCARGNSVLVLTEDTQEDVHRTLYAVCQGMELTAQQKRAIEQSVVTYALAGQDMKLLARDDRSALVKTPHFFNLKEKILEIGNVVFVGIDPALSVTEGDETNQNDQRMLGKMVDDLAVRTGATVLLAAHSTKGSQQADELTSHNSRGGGAITDAVRAEYALRTMTAAEAKKAGISDLEERKRLVQLVATKGNHLPPAAYVPIWLRRGNHGTLSNADVCIGDGAGPNDQDLAALDILRDMAKTGSPKLVDWRSRCEQNGVLKQANERTRQKAMERIVSRLRDAGLVEKGFSRGVYQPVIGE